TTGRRTPGRSPASGCRSRWASSRSSGRTSASRWAASTSPARSPTTSPGAWTPPPARPTASPRRSTVSDAGRAGSGVPPAALLELLAAPAGARVVAPDPLAGPPDRFGHLREVLDGDGPLIPHRRGRRPHRPPLGEPAVHLLQLCKTLGEPPLPFGA